MAYTRPWAEVFALPGSRDSDEIDDNDREHHVDFTERFGDILYDVTADPWKLKIPGLNLDNTQSAPVPLPAGVIFGTAPNTLAFDVTDMSVKPVAVGTGNSWVGQIQAPYGSTLKAIEVRVLRSIVGAAVTVTLRKVDSAGVNTNILVQAAPVDAALQYVLMTGLTESMVGARYFVEVNLVADASGVGTAKLLFVNVNYLLPGAA